MTKTWPKPDGRPLKEWSLFIPRQGVPVQSAEWNGRRRRMYPKSSHADYKKTVGQYALSRAPPELLTKPLIFNAVFTTPYPVTMPMWVRKMWGGPDALVPKDRGANLDNLIKGTQDGLQGPVYIDDKIICAYGQVIKCWWHRPGIWIRLREFDAESYAKELTIISRDIMQGSEQNDGARVGRACQE